MTSESIQRLDDTFSTAPQLRPDDLQAVAAAGFRSVINHRPDFEGGPDQPTDAQMREAARQAGLAYAHQPVVASRLGPADAVRLSELLRTLPAPVLAFCRTGTRSRRLFEAAAQMRPPEST